MRLSEVIWIFLAVFDDADRVQVPTFNALPVMTIVTIEMILQEVLCCALT